MGKYREREVISGVDGDSVGFPRCALVATQQDEDKHKAPSSTPHRPLSLRIYVGRSIVISAKVMYSCLK